MAKKVWEYRKDFLRASSAYSKVNREVGECLEALHEAMCRRNAMRPRYERASKAIDMALRRQMRDSRS